MTFQAYGDRAILINFEQKIDPVVNAEVIDLKKAVEHSEITGITFCIPAYCSLTIGYDPFIIGYDQLCEEIRSLQVEKVVNTVKRKLNIPVCYEGPYAPDLENVCEQTDLSREAIIQLHTANPFQVYMLGFLPGFPYMGKLPEELYCKRKDVPAKKVPAQSVGIAGFQTGIYPIEAPGGWQIIGRTPIPVFNPNKEQGFLLQSGDLVQFRVITAKTFQVIEKAISSGKFNMNTIYE